MNEQEKNIFTQISDLEKYDKPLTNVYEKLIVPVMNEEVEGVANFKWGQTMCQESSALARCDYDTYESLKAAGKRTTHRDDSITYSYPNHDCVSDSLDEAIKHLYALNKENNSALTTFISSVERSERGLLR